MLSMIVCIVDSLGMYAYEVCMCAIHTGETWRAHRHTTTQHFADIQHISVHINVKDIVSAVNFKIKFISLMLLFATRCVFV